MTCPHGHPRSDRLGRLVGWGGIFRLLVGMRVRSCHRLRRGQSVEHLVELVAPLDMGARGEA